MNPGLKPLRKSRNQRRGFNDEWLEAGHRLYGRQTTTTKIHSPCARVQEKNPASKSNRHFCYFNELQLEVNK